MVYLTMGKADIRKRSIIKSDAGHLMIIPREDRLVRCYVQLSPSIAAAFKKEYLPNILVSLVQDILKPYTFGTSHIEWSTIYSVRCEPISDNLHMIESNYELMIIANKLQVGQRLCNVLSIKNQIFLAGDAVHTHSPKAGRGMNVSIQDTYNLGWKLSSVIKGKLHPSILNTYQDERLAVARNLIAFDKRMVEGVCMKDPADSPYGPMKGSSLKEVLKEENTSASGLGTRYGPSLISTPPRGLRDGRQGGPLLPVSKEGLATDVTLGARIPNAQVLCQSDSSLKQIHHLLRSTGQWHLMVFGGDISDARQFELVKKIGEDLVRKESTIYKMNQHESVVGGVTPYLIHCASRWKVELMDIPNAFRPFSEEYGFDYWKTFADNWSDGEDDGSAYRLYGIGGEGCVLLIRPDQHVAFIGGLGDLAAIELFLQDLLPH